MAALNTEYSPLTSRPYLRDSTYAEYPPCEALKPYIYCFWGNDENCREIKTEEKKVLVVPDTCVDIIFEINHTRQRITSRLCGIQDQPYYSRQSIRDERIATFAVRFHFWSIGHFFKLKMSELYNRALDMELIESDWNSFFQPLFYLFTMKERIQWMERYFLRRLDTHQFNCNLLNSVSYILTHSGSKTVKDICQYSSVSQRQMERLFKEHIGVSVKRTAGLVRYQNVWREIAFGKSFDIMEAVCRYGYSDQSHLLREFKRYHGVTPGEALKIAERNG